MAYYDLLLIYMQHRVNKCIIWHYKKCFETKTTYTLLVTCTGTKKATLWVGASLTFGSAKC